VCLAALLRAFQELGGGLSPPPQVFEGADAEPVQTRRLLASLVSTDRGAALAEEALRRLLDLSASSTALQRHLRSQCLECGAALWPAARRCFCG
jgi:hypothetical protein